MFRQRVAETIRMQFRGIAPEKVARSISLRLTLGIFPVVGTTTLLCFLAALLLRLNQPAIQSVNYLASPLQAALIFAFVRLGEWTFGASPVSFSITGLMELFWQDPWEFVVRFGLSGLHGIVGWLLVAPLVVGSLYFALLFVLRRWPTRSTQSVRF